MNEYIFVGEFENKASGIRHTGTYSVYANNKDEAYDKFLNENEYDVIPLTWELVRIIWLIQKHCAFRKEIAFFKKYLPRNPYFFSIQ